MKPFLEGEIPPLGPVELQTIFQDGRVHYIYAERRISDAEPRRLSWYDQPS